MFWKKIDETGDDEGTTCWTEACRRGHFVCFSIIKGPFDDSTLTRENSPNGKKTISPEDRELLELHGAAVVECSWARIKEVPYAKIGGKCERICMYCIPDSDQLTDSF